MYLFQSFKKLDFFFFLKTCIIIKITYIIAHNLWKVLGSNNLLHVRRWTSKMNYKPEIVQTVEKIIEPNNVMSGKEPVWVDGMVYYHPSLKVNTYVVSA